MDRSAIIPVCEHGFRRGDLHQYLSGIFSKKNERGQTGLGYGLFTIGLWVSNAIFEQDLYVALFTFVGIYALAQLFYASGLPSRIFATVYFSILTISSETLTLSLVSHLWRISLQQVLENPSLLIISAVIVKLIQILLVKASVLLIRHRRKDSFPNESKLMLPLLLCQLFSIAFTTMLFMILSDQYHINQSVVLLSLTGIIYMNMIIFWYFDRIRELFALRSAHEASEYKLKLQAQYHDLLMVHQRDTDLLWHDMKKHIRLMKTLINQSDRDITHEYVHALECRMDQALKMIRTDYPILSALLTEQNQRARKEQIDFQIDVRIDGTLKIAPVDLCIILGNLYDNAFDACMRIDRPANRFIKMTFSQKGNILMIEMENPYDAATAPRPRFGKHGFGQTNVQRSVEGYGGRVRFTQDENIYRASIVIP